MSPKKKREKLQELHENINFTLDIIIILSKVND